MNEKEAIKNVKEQLEGIKKANECGLATRGEFNKDIEAIETVLEELENKDNIINEMAEYISKTDSTMFYNKLNVIQEFEYVVEGRR